MEKNLNRRNNNTNIFLLCSLATTFFFEYEWGTPRVILLKTYSTSRNSIDQFQTFN